MTEVEGLRVQGFFIVDLGLEHKEELLAKARRDAADFETSGPHRLFRPSELVFEGLLGEEGSARIAHLQGPDDDEEIAGEGLRALDKELTDLAVAAGPFFKRALGFDVTSRSGGLLHETGPLEGVIAPLTEGQASCWLETFAFGKVMCIICIGPGSGTLELRPYDDKASEAYKMDLSPGTVVVVRSDCLSVKHLCRTRTLLLSCHLLVPGGNCDVRTLTPCAKRLNDWIGERLQVLKDLETTDKRADIPRHLQLLMNRQCFKGQYMAVRGMSSRASPSLGTDDWFGRSAQGLDGVIQVPLMRWEMDHMYDPDPDCWQWSKTFARHMSMVDGIEMFDNKMFGISVAESKIMDPQQRVVLEVGYEALFSAGYKKGRIMNSLGGMYLGYGTAAPDWQNVQRTGDGGAESSFGATSGSASITANRFSFCLGMKGPSVAVDAEDASGLLTMHMGCEALQARGRNQPSEFSVVGAIKLHLSPHFWPQRQAAGWLSGPGRCFTFDASADGFVHGDAAVNMVVKPLTEMVDGAVVIREGEPFLAAVCGSAVRHAGRTASMSAPDGPTEQEVISAAVYAAGLSGFDIDSAECYGAASALADPVEVSSCSRVLRLADDDEEPLFMLAGKSVSGNAFHAGGAVSMLRVILAAAAGYTSPNCHLRLANPHIDTCELPLAFPSEVVQHRMPSSFATSMARGYGGTHTCVVTLGEASAANLEPPEAPKRDALVFWPGGAGPVPEGSMPRRGFYIAGTFSQWSPEPMQPEASDVFGYTLTLGENRWEQFQIWLDGDAKLCLFPENHKAPGKTSVLGPASSSRNCWMLDTRLKDVQKMDQVPTADVQAGTQFRVRLRIAGKWRMVEWEKLGPADEASMSEVQRPATYFVSADWNGWGLEPMVHDAIQGVFTLDAHLIRPGGEFQMVRNRDWEQVMYPMSSLDRQSPDDGVGGPDSESAGRSWHFHGAARDTFRILLRRSTDGPVDRKEVSFSRTGDRPFNEEQLAQLSRARYTAFGTWDGGERLRELRWTGSCHQFYIVLGETGRESFQLLQDFDWNKIVHPSEANAHQGIRYTIQGPGPGDGRSQGLNWTIGMEGYEKAGTAFEVQVYSQANLVTNVRWQQVEDVTGSVLRKAAEDGLLFGAPFQL
ncbi:unnamed protein product [Polarella glacialis]|uniref:Ketosynthase family 3 (KS3) domain-containing protein n=1 Tax=Polarella glacialis TaxID=89957 RepID=A0A813L2Z2_POLGL|nr:unnamed protein product [Polarella glacialis]